MPKFKPGHCINCFTNIATHNILNSNICETCLTSYIPSLAKLATRIAPPPTPPIQQIQDLPPYLPSDYRYDAHRISTTILHRLFDPPTTILPVTIHRVHEEHPPLPPKPITQPPTTPQHDILGRKPFLGPQPAKVVYRIPMKPRPIQPPGNTPPANDGN